jgi:hypothetical protein
MTLLTENDWKAVRNALHVRKDIEIDCTYAPTNARVVVSVTKVDAPWSVPAVVKVIGYFRGGVWHQYFESVEAAKEAIKQWDGWL